MPLVSTIPIKPLTLVSCPAKKMLPNPSTPISLIEVAKGNIPARKISKIVLGQTFQISVEVKVIEKQ